MYVDDTLVVACHSGGCVGRQLHLLMITTHPGSKYAVETTSHPGLSLVCNADKVYINHNKSGRQILMEYQLQSI